jgi:hypothetical protein
MMKLGAVLMLTAAAAAAISAASAAQDTATAVFQISTNPDEPMRQISPATTPVVPTVRAPLTAEAPLQLGAASRSASPTEQLTKTSETQRTSPQVSDGHRDARPPQPLSHPVDGRTSAVERVAGKDRCDLPRGKARAPRCANVIENRAAQYSSPQPPELSPEQKLLMSERASENATTFESAARRLARTGQTDESLQSLGVASVVLGTRPDVPKESKPDEPAQSEATQAIINAIINGASPPPQ